MTTTTTDRSDAIRRLQGDAWNHWAHQLGQTTDAAVAQALTTAKRSYLAAFAAMQAASILSREHRDAQALAGKRGREFDWLMAIVDALGATIREVNEAIDAAKLHGCPRPTCTDTLNPMTGRCPSCGATEPGMPA